MSNIEPKKVSKEDVQVEEVVSARKTLSKEDREELKRKYRQAHLDYAGRLYIDDKFRKPGKRLRVDNADPATVKYMKSLGWNVVIDTDVKVGSGSLREPSNMGSAVHIEQSIHGTSQPGILYEIDEEAYQLRKEVEAELNSEQVQSKKDEMHKDIDPRRMLGK